MKSDTKKQLDNVLKRLNEVVSAIQPQQPAQTQPAQALPKAPADVQNLQKVGLQSTQLQRAGSYINTVAEFQGALVQALNNIKYVPTSIPQAQMLLAQALKDPSYINSKNFV